MKNKQETISKKHLGRRSKKRVGWDNSAFGKFSLAFCVILLIPILASAVSSNDPRDGIVEDARKQITLSDDAMGVHHEDAKGIRSEKEILMKRVEILEQEELLKKIEWATEKGKKELAEMLLEKYDLGK